MVSRLQKYGIGFSPRLTTVVFALAFLVTFLNTQSAHATPFCTRDNAQLTGLRGCVFFISDTVEQGFAAEDAKVAQDSLEFQFHTPVRRDGTDVYFRVLRHRNNGIEVIGQMSEAEYNFNRSNLVVNFNTLPNALRTGMGNQGTYAYLPSLPALGAMLGGDAVVWSAFRLGHELLNRRGFTTRGFNPTIFGLLGRVGAPNMISVGRALFFGGASRWATIRNLVGTGGAAIAGTAAVAGSELFIYMLATQRLVDQPIYHATQDYFNTYHYGYAVAFREILTGNIPFIEGCVNDDASCGRLRVAAHNTGEIQNASNNPQSQANFVAALDQAASNGGNNSLAAGLNAALADAGQSEGGAAVAAPGDGGAPAQGDAAAQGDASANGAASGTAEATPPVHRGVLATIDQMAGMEHSVTDSQGAVARRPMAVAQLDLFERAFRAFFRPASRVEERNGQRLTVPLPCAISLGQDVCFRQRPVVRSATTHSRLTDQLR